MKNRLFIAVSVAFWCCFLPTGWAMVKSGTKSPVGSGTVPPSSVRSGLVRSPAPIDTSSNLLITGNVRGSKYFRGIVPYRATTDFRAGLGSSSLDSFLRRSAGSEDFGTFTAKPRPYYSPTRTVTTTRPGYSGVFRPPTMIKDSTVDRFALPPLLGKPALPRSDAVASPLLVAGRGRPMSVSPPELEKLLSHEVEEYSQSRKQIPIDDIGRQRQEQMEQFRWDLKLVNDKAVELEQSLISQDESSRLSTKPEPSRPVRQQFETQAPWEQQPQEQRSEDSQPDIYEQIEVKELSEGISQQFEMQAPKEQTSKESQLDVYEQMKQQIDSLQKGFKRLPVAARKSTRGRLTAGSRGERAKETAGYEKQTSEEGYQKNYRKKSSPLEGLSDIDLSVRAKDILGEHKTFASFSKDKFNQHLRAAEDYLKQGRYYRAADAYTLASLYKPADPLAYAGKSHALFAAGEYMSSALFLSRALEIFPEYARFKIDIEAMVGDKDKLESRIADIEQWLERNDAGELQFLLGYVYYQMGRVERAKKEIDSAYEKMPESPAVATLKEVIND